ncbi:MAG: extracellular solute-binding protein [Alphaproteobacteria bacterium]|nr:extracellular solute-binding protein [Alphaproteobacteria bacterium]
MVSSTVTVATGVWSHVAMAFNPTEFSNGISQGILPETVRSYIHAEGTLANVHFVAIPFNANAPEAAQVVADFLLSPEAQIKKADSAIWGDPTVLDVSKLSASDQADFMALPRGLATLSESDLGQTLAEPHPSWVGVIEREWARRYTGQ